MFNRFGVAGGFVVCALASSAFAQCEGWDPGFGVLNLGANAGVHRMLVIDTGNGPQLHAFGNFSMIGGVSAPGAARWNGTAWSPLGTGQSAGDSIQALEAVLWNNNGTPQLVAGLFAPWGPQGQASAVVAWNGSQWQPLPGAITQRVDALQEFQGKLFVGGNFTSVGGQPSERLAAWNGSAWQRFDPGMGAIYSHTFWSAAVGEHLSVAVQSGESNWSVWSFDGSRWARRADTSIPSWNPTDSASAYDSLRHRVLLFNGLTGQMYSTSGGTLTPAGAPAPWAPLSSIAAAYDSTRDRVIIAAGYRNGAVAETWAYDCVTSTWANLAPATSFTPRRLGAIGYDPLRDRVVLYGWYDTSTFAYMGDTWEFDGVTWSQSPVPAIIDSPNFVPSMVFDPSAGAMRILRQGGFGTSAVWLTSVFNPATGWSQDSSVSIPAGAEIGLHQVSINPTSGQLLLPANRRTWLLNGGVWQAAPLGGFDERVLTMTLHDDGAGEKLWIGGLFDRAGSIVSDSLATYNGTTFANPTMGQVGGTGVAVLRSVPSGPLAGLYAAGGGLRRFQPDYAEGIARWDGAKWSSLAGIRGGFNDLIAYDDGTGQVLLGSGGINQPTGFTSNLLAWNGAEWSQRPPVPFEFGNPQGALVSTRLLRHDLGSGPLIYAFGPVHSYTAPQFRGMARYGNACSAPIFLNSPTSVTPAMFNQLVTFSVSVTGTAPVTYQWRRNFQAISDIPNRISGSTTTQLTLMNWSLNDAGVYDCVASNPIGQTTSTGAAFTVPGLPPFGPVSITPVVTVPRESDVPDRPYIAASMSAVSNTKLMGTLGRVFQENDIVACESDEVTVVMNGATAPRLEGEIEVRSLGIQHIDQGNRFLFSAEHDFGPNYVTAEWFFDGQQSTLLRRSDVEPPDWNAVPLTTNAASARDGKFVTRGLGNEGGRVWQWIPSQPPQLIASGGAALPGSSIIANDVSNQAFINSAGDVTVSGTRIYRRLGGTWSNVIGPGSVVPGLSTRTFTSVGNRVLRDDGSVVYVGSWLGPTPIFGVFSAPATGSQSLLFRSNVTLSSSTGSRRLLASMDMLAATNASGSILLKGETQATNCTPQPGQPCPIPYGAWLVRPGQAPLEIWRDGLSSPPGAWPHTTMPSLGTVSFALGAEDFILMEVQQNGYSIVGWTPATGLITIIGSGAQVEVAPGVYKTVSGADIVGRENQHDAWDSDELNDDQSFFAKVNFVDGTMGYYRCWFGNAVQAFRACPTLISRPRSVTSPQGSIATFETSVVGQGTLSYQWRRNGVAISNGTTPGGSVISGANSAALRIDGVSAADQGSYDCVVSNSCGGIVTPAATYTVGVVCDSIDFNGDGARFDPADIDAFLSVFSEGPCIPETSICNDIDFNNDGSSFDPCDIDVFLQVFSEGPCGTC